MAKVKKAYFCRNCGFEAPKWLGRCPSCGEWNTFTEEIIAKAPSGTAAAAAAMPQTPPQRVTDIERTSHRRLDLHNAEVNRVLGGGLVPGSLILLGGEPGIGKSTLSLQLALTNHSLRTLYVSGEESPEQIGMRAERLGIENEECYIYSETLLENILAQMAQYNPDVVVIDSIQTIYTEAIESSAGSVSQIRECAASLLKYAKTTGTSIFIIGHITKDGTIAGPKILEHIVDVVLHFEGDSNNIYRILRGIKNRFGATFEIGVFEMLETGLRTVDNPSEILLSHYDEPLSGIAVGASVDGIRPYLIEVQDAARRIGETRRHEDVRQGCIPQFRRRIQGLGYGTRSGYRRRRHILILRPPHRRRHLLCGRDRTLGRGAARTPNRTAHKRSGTSRIPPNNSLVVPAQGDKKHTRHRDHLHQQHRRTATFDLLRIASHKAAHAIRSV